MSDGMPTSDELIAWIKRAKAGDRPALERLLERFRPLMYARSQESLGAAMRTRVGDSDVVQQACFAIYRDISHFQGEAEGEFVQWILRILERQILKVVEREKGAAKRSIDREVSGSQPVRNAPGELTSPSQKAMHSETKVILERAISQLPEGQQQVVRLKYIDELKLSEIVEKLGRTEDAVTSLLRRAIMRLNQLLKDEF